MQLIPPSLHFCTRLLCFVFILGSSYYSRPSFYTSHSIIIITTYLSMTSYILAKQNLI